MLPTRVTQHALISFLSKTAQFETDKVSAKPLSARAIEGTVEKQAEPKLGLAWVDTNFANL